MTTQPDQLETRLAEIRERLRIAMSRLNLSDYESFRFTGEKMLHFVCDDVPYLLGVIEKQTVKIELLRRVLTSVAVRYIQTNGCDLFRCAVCGGVSKGTPPTDGHVEHETDCVLYAAAQPEGTVANA